MASVDPPLDDSVLRDLARYDSPTLANAIETFDVRPRNAGYMGHEIRAMFPEAPPMVGYAVTGRIRAAEPSPGSYSRREWWEYVRSLPAPRIVVFEDLDQPAAVGAFWGEVNASIHQALGCLGVVTNGSVRDLTEVRAQGFGYFAAAVAVSHAYVRLEDFGSPVTVGGMTVEPGALLYADAHGVLGIPLDIAPLLPAAADELLAQERRVIEFCRSPNFTPEGLSELMR
jgi:4-hydroxy-4-methyl-2-oxoglutarate aldolase